MQTGELTCKEIPRGNSQDPAQYPADQKRAAIIPLLHLTQQMMGSSLLPP